MDAVDGPPEVPWTSFSHSSRGFSKKRRSMVQPTLLTSTSTGPKPSTACSTIAETLAGSVTSVGTTITRLPVPIPATSAATISPWLGASSAITMLDPSTAKAWTMARPMFEPPPVTITFFPFSPSSTSGPPLLSRWPAFRRRRHFGHSAETEPQQSFDVLDCCLGHVYGAGGVVVPLHRHHFDPVTPFGRDNQ